MCNRWGVVVLADIHDQEGQNTALGVDTRRLRQAELDILEVHRGLEERRRRTANGHGEGILRTRQATLLSNCSSQKGEESDVHSRHIALGGVFVSTIHVGAVGCGGQPQPLGQQRLAHVYVCGQHYPGLGHIPAGQGIDMWKETWGLKNRHHKEKRRSGNRKRK
jgi:hypothetical protein